jgi:hypothetical protein
MSADAQPQSGTDEVGPAAATDTAPPSPATAGEEAPAPPNDGPTPAEAAPLEEGTAPAEAAPAPPRSPLQRAFSGLSMLIYLLLVGVAGEAYLYRFLQDRTHLVRAVDNWRRDPDRGRPSVWIFGTCHGAGLNAKVVEEAWGSPTHVINVGAAASTPVDWWVAQRAMFAEAQAQGLPLPDAIILAPAGADLMLNPSPWSSQTMELAGWDELLPILSATCTDLSCVAELSLRKASRLYRYRGYLGQLFWAGLGVPSPAPPPIEGDTDGEDVASPNRFRGAWLSRPAGAVRPSQEAAKPGNRLEAARWRLDASLPGLEPTVDPYHWTRQIEAEAEAHGVQTLIYTIPPRPGAGREREVAHHRSELGALAAQIGAELVGGEPIEALTAAHYFDDQHLLNTAQHIVAEDLGRALAARSAAP